VQENYRRNQKNTAKKANHQKDITEAAQAAAEIVNDTLLKLPKAKTFNYGGHVLKFNEYSTCKDCTSAIAEAQQAEKALFRKSRTAADPLVREHLELATELMHYESKAAEIRAEFHGGQDSEPILNNLLGFIYSREIHDKYEHNHRKG
jgi:hypothetical protein